ncbi:LAGLIDADG family homing endonuclease [Halarchaeum salinum]|uniref:DNA helicase n=1 Tax=Halarchaeum salinum TaxID=489912 RepID=A0AAV3S650_9EURY
MAQATDQELVDRFETFLRRYYSDEVGNLARNYPRDQKSLRVDWGDLYQFDADLADDYLRYPDRYQEAAEEALRRYDLPIDVSLGQAHVRVRGIAESTEIRALRSEHLNTFIAIQGIIRKATEVRPKIEQAVFVCQRCNYETQVPQSDSGFQEPYQCESCERQGPFKLDPEKSEFIDAQKLRIQENPEGLAGGETPENIDVHVEDDLTGQVTPGDHVTATGSLRLDQSEGSNESPIFDVYMEGNHVEIEDEQFEDMEITSDDKEEIIGISQRPNIYEDMVDSVAPSIYGHRQAKLAMLLQLFSGVTKHLPDGSRIRGDLHMLLIGDPGTGKCLDGDTRVTLDDGTERPIREIVEENLDDPTPVDDGVWDAVDIPLPSMEANGSLTERRATKVWKREAPEEMYRVRTASGRELDVTPSHPLFVQSGGHVEARRAEDLTEGEFVAVAPRTVTDGGTTAMAAGATVGEKVAFEPIRSIERVEPAEEWVYDLEVEGTHTYLSNGVVSHNSQLLSYVQNIAPRSVYTSGKGSSSAGLCVTGDTLVHTAEGVREIRDIVSERLPEPVDEETAVEDAVELYTFDRDDGAIDTRSTSHLWRMPEKPCRRIETAHGKEIEASVNTPVLTCGKSGIEWKPISEIEAGDHVAAPRYDNIERSELHVRNFLELTEEKVKIDDTSVSFVRDALVERFGTLRDAAAELGISEDFVYDSLRNRHVAPEKLDVVLDAVDATRDDVTYERTMLRHGDSVRIPEVFDDDLMYLVGLVFGDGDIALDRRGDNRGLVRLSNGDESLLERAREIFAEKFDKHVEIERQDERVPCIRVSNATIARLFANVGMRTPKADLALDPRFTTAEHADAFVRGLMDADGAVSQRSNGGSSVLLSTISERLSEQLQAILETYGVRARTRERDRRGTYELANGRTIESKHVQHFVELYGANIERYADVIGFESAAKRVALDGVAGDAARREETIPVGSALATVNGPSGDYYMNVNRGDNPGRGRARAMLNDLDLGGAEPLVEEAVDADLRWDEVVAAVDTGEKEVFDLTVPETHNFVGNGIVAHNTAAAVRDDFGDGQQWTLEAGALVLADQGIAAVDELDKMAPDDRSAMHEALEQQSYHGDTEVFLADGRRVEIGAFVDDLMAANADEVVDGVNCEILPVDDVRVHSTDLETNTTEKVPVDRVSRHEAPDEFVRVSFSNGREVTVTPEHPLFVGMDGETVDARDVETGAFVPAPRKTPNSAAAVELDDEPSVDGREKEVRLPETMSGDLAEFLGLLVAEGHSYAGSSHEIGFSNQDERLLARAATLAERVFGIESADATNEAGTVTKRWVSTRLYRWFERNVPEVMHTAREKRVPAKVLGASAEEIRRFLVGAFAGDGGVESEAMAFSTASDGLAEDYADALGKIGVASRIHHDSAEDSWKVYAMGDSTERFVDAVVSEADDRHEAARAFVERSNETPRHHDVLPTSAAEEIRDLKRLLGVRLTGQFKSNVDEGFGVRVETVESELEDLRKRADAVREALDGANGLADVRSAIGWSGRQVAERLDGETTSAIHYAEDGGYDETRRAELAERARDAVGGALDEFEARASALDAACDLRYYRVTDVETVPNEDQEWVYDVTVEPTNTFVSKGVVLHNSISVSKAGINATLKSRCSLLGAANPKYGRFDQYESIGEQIDLEPALISRFDLIFTVTDQPDPEEDARLAEHILQTNYAGELHTQREHLASANYTEDEVAAQTNEVAPEIDAQLLRKYIAYARRNVYPAMSDEARAAIEEFYVDLRAEGSDEDAPVPVTARKLEALVRLAEASARVRLSDTVEKQDAERVIAIVRSCLEAIGVDPETGEFDADVVETGTSKSQRDRIKSLRALIEDIEDDFEEGAPTEEVMARAEEVGMERSKAEHEIEKLKKQGEVYEPSNGHLRTT